MIAILSACVVAAIAVVLVVDPFGGGAGNGAAAADNATPVSLATVTRRTLSSQNLVNGTLGYAGSYTILNEASGHFTRLPSVGQVIGSGQIAYRVDGKPVVLLGGSTPAYRTLSEGMSGADVRELNRDLVALGYATRSQLDPRSDYFSSETAYALERLQDHLGVIETSALALGDAIFEPRAMRITAVTATLGGQAGPGEPVAHATSTRQEVTVALDAAQQANVKPGDRVAVTLPDNSVVPGVVSSVGTVASSSSSGGGSGSGGSGSTVDVYVRLLHPRAAGGLDQAPVQVAITTGTVTDALVVPVNALLALASGGYAVEVVDASGHHRLVPITLGLFDDGDGLVQVTGVGLAAGQRVVVPAGG